MKRLVRGPALFVLGACSGGAWGAGVTGAGIEEIVVHGDRIALGGAPRSASEGTVLAEQLEHRPLLRTGELLEVVPGMIVTQHTGDGKANQYFLRGFNLDHGTDFSTSIDGVPVNLPTHGHGQGYMDLGFVMPELVDRVVHHKGTYYAELGNFSAAGAATMHYRDEVAPLLSLGLGEDGYVRLLAAGSVAAAGCQLLVGIGHDRTDGPWQLAESLRRNNALLRYARSGDDGGFSVSLMGYHGEWTSTDQVPRRAVVGGSLDRYGFVDDSNGGDSHRYSLSGEGRWGAGAGEFDVTAYAIDYRLQLFSNFTYATDPVRGDQFEQFDDRHVLGGSATYTRPFAAGALPAGTWRAGIEVRHDDIDPVGLHRTTRRQRYATVREDAVRQTLAALFTSLSTTWRPWLRSELGVRLDRLAYDVDSDLAVNSDSGHDSLASPKLSLAIGPFADTEFFVAAGRGYHGNDVRGAAIRVDPVDGVTPVGRVQPLVAARGAEVGLRSALLPRSQVAVALWRLDIDSELLFVGDGGTTEAQRGSRRRGVEVGFYARPFDHVIVDADLAWSRARFRGDDPAGDHIPGAVERVASLGIVVDLPSGWSGGIRLRHLGPAALIEDDSVRASSTTLVNVEAGYRFTRTLSLTAGVFNVFDVQANDITYFYESQLAGEAEPVEDIHFHPAEPRALRATLRLGLQP
jgi:outer membrane receptor protein involved in Fe transport